MEINRQIYDENIWNIISNIIFDLYKTNEWYLLVNCSDCHYKISPWSSDEAEKITKVEIKSFIDVEEGGAYKIDGWVNSSGAMIPIILNGLVVFYIGINGLQNTGNLMCIQMFIESLVKKEAENHRLYPSFLPYFIPYEDSEVVKSNTALNIKKKFFFLNGLMGTGKHTFIKNHLMYCYQDNIDYLFIKKLEVSSIHKVYSKTRKMLILIVNELAYLSEEDQIKLMAEINDNSSKVIFICSAYDPAVLTSRGVLLTGLANLCIQEKLIFPSLHRRFQNLQKILITYYLWKGIILPPFFNEKWIAKQNLSSGFQNFFELMYNFFVPLPSISDSFKENQGIREIIKETEVLAIDYAIRIIGNSQNKIAKFLGISRGSLQHKLKKYNYPYHEWEE